MSLLPQSFLTEIEQDAVYATIFGELQKKRPTLSAPTTNSTPEHEHHKAMTPHFAAADDDHISVIDEISTDLLDEAQLEQSNDGYDTDIEIGKMHAFT